MLGLIVMLILSKMDYHFWYRHATLIYLVTVVLLIIVLIPGIGLERNGSQSWIGVGPLSVQPAELAKAGVLMLTAGLISTQRKKLSVRQTFFLMLIVLLPFGIIMLQPDLDTGTVLAGSGLALLFLAGVSIRFLCSCLEQVLRALRDLLLLRRIECKGSILFWTPGRIRLAQDFRLSSLFMQPVLGAFWCGFF